MIKARFDYVQNKASAVMPKEKMPQKGNHDKSKPTHKLCQECGMNIHKKVFNRHLQNVHFGQKQKCPHCTQELSNEKSLKTHNAL